MFILGVSSFIALSCACSEEKNCGVRVRALDDSAWKVSEWISAKDAPVVTDTTRSWKGLRAADGASWFVMDISNDKPVRSVRWMTTGLGVYSLHVNVRFSPIYFYYRRLDGSIAFERYLNKVDTFGAIESRRDVTRIAFGRDFVFVKTFELEFHVNLRFFSLKNQTILILKISFFTRSAMCFLPGLCGSCGSKIANDPDRIKSLNSVPSGALL